MTKNGPSAYDASKSITGIDSSPTRSDSSSQRRRRYVLSTIILCLCSLTNGFLMISVFPYAGFMVLDLLPPGRGATTENAGLYAGLIASSFMLGRFFTAYQWGRLADYYGRVWTLQASLVASMVFSLLFGTAKSLTAALVWRACLGMANGMLSTTKTLATEVAHGDDTREKRTMGLVIGMRSWAMLVGPAVGGFLAEPLQQYPALKTLEWMQDSYFATLLARYPFILPNAVGALLCLIGAVSAGCILEETLDEHARHDPNNLLPDCWDYITRSRCEKRNASKEEETPITLLNTPPPAPPPSSVWSSPITRKHMICHWMFSVVSTYIDEAFPLFCMSTAGGLGLAESSIGKIMSAAGLIFAICQYATFKLVTDRFGLYTSLMIGCVLGSFPPALIPVSVLFRASSSAGWILGVLIGLTKVMHSLYFTSMAVAINKTVTKAQRAKMNALVLVGNSVGKGFGPPAAGAIVTFSNSSIAFPAEYGSLLVWSLVPVLGLIVLRQLVWLRKTMQMLKARETSQRVETTAGPV